MVCTRRLWVRNFTTIPEPHEIYPTPHGSVWIILAQRVGTPTVKKKKEKEKSDEYASPRCDQYWICSELSLCFLKVADYGNSQHWDRTDGIFIKSQYKPNEKIDVCWIQNH